MCLALEKSNPALWHSLTVGFKAVIGSWALLFLWDLCEFISLDIIVHERGAEKAVVDSTLGFLRPLWFALGGLAVLDNVGVSVASLITGLGIGGLAVALSTQNVLQDLCAGLGLFLDQPFKVSRMPDGWYFCLWLMGKMHGIKDHHMVFSFCVVIGGRHCELWWFPRGGARYRG